jgi:hypothetical protein
MERVLTEAVQSCDAGELPGCPLIDVLSAPAPLNLVGDRHGALLGRSAQAGAASYRENGLRKGCFDRRGGTAKRSFCYVGYSSEARLIHVFSNLSRFPEDTIGMDSKFHTLTTGMYRAIGKPVIFAASRANWPEGVDFRPAWLLATSL